MEVEGERLSETMRDMETARYTEAIEAANCEVERSSAYSAFVDERCAWCLDLINCIFSDSFQT